MTKTVVWAFVLSIAAALIQSTLLVRLTVFGCVPDLALGILVYVSYVNGVMTGQTLGFISGIGLDFISASPLGFNSFVRTVVGALAGLLKGTFFLDFFILPFVLCVSATIAKALLVSLLSFLFVAAVPHYDFLSSKLWIEVALNGVCAPFLFAFLNLFKSVLRPRKET